MDVLADRRRLLKQIKKGLEKTKVSVIVGTHRGAVSSVRLFDKSLDAETYVRAWVRRRINLTSEEKKTIRSMEGLAGFLKEYSSRKHTVQGIYWFRNYVLEKPQKP